MLENQNSPLDILKEEEKQLKNQIPSFLSETAKSTPSKLLEDYEKTGNNLFKQAAGKALDALRSAVDSAKEWSSDNAAGAMTGVGVVGTILGGAAATGAAASILSQNNTETNDSSSILDKAGMVGAAGLALGTPKGRRQIAKKGTKFLRDKVGRFATAEQGTAIVEDVVRKLTPTQLKTVRQFVDVGTSKVGIPTRSIQQKDLLKDFRRMEIDYPRNEKDLQKFMRDIVSEAESVGAYKKLHVNNE